MLRKLDIKNIALIDQTSLPFDAGLTVLTGETGAGKSVIVTALTLALGGRGEREFIRHGSSTAMVTAEFDEFVINREITRSGSGKVKINGINVTLNKLRELTEPTAQILGQHAGQMLMNEDNHLRFLDQFAGLHSQREAVETAYTKWRQITDELRRTHAKREQLIQERELLLFQKDEIEKASLKVGEEEQLLTEKRLLDSAQNLMASAATIEDILGGDNSNALDLVSLARNELEKMASVDQSLEKQVNEITEMSFQLEELRRTIEQYGSSIQDDPVRLEEINLRLDEIYKLKKKYGGSEEATLATLDRINEKLKNRPDVDSIIESLSTEEEQCRTQYTTIALKLSKSRQKAARLLNKLVVNELKELAIDGAQFKCDLIYEEATNGIIVNDKAVKPFPHGLETARFLFSANPGEPLKSLVKTASGGEMSRVLLALKSAELAGQAPRGPDNKNATTSPPLLVFDEVDAGIGGRTAIEVGKKLKRLSQTCQVLVITHLHQIARLADHHFVAEKTTAPDSRTIITVRKLKKHEIPDELERMVGLPVNK